MRMLSPGGTVAHPLGIEDIYDEYEDDELQEHPLEQDIVQKVLKRIPVRDVTGEG